MDALALTDRDGTYGAVRFAKAAMAMGVRPILGVDLAFADPASFQQMQAGSHPRSPTRGGASRDPRLPRVTFLASGRSGWAAVCRLVSATHAAGERGTPVCTPELVADHVSGSRRPGAARSCLRAGTGIHAASRRPRPRGPGSLAGPRRPRPADRRGGLPPAARVRAGVLAARRADGGSGPFGEDTGPGRALQRSPLRRPARRPDDRRTRRSPTAGADGPAPPRPAQRRGLLEVRQADARGGRGDLSLRRAGRPWRPRPARPHPRGRRPVRPRPPRGSRYRRGALPGVRGQHGSTGGVSPAQRARGAGPPGEPGWCLGRPAGGGAPGPPCSGQRARAWAGARRSGVAAAAPGGSVDGTAPPGARNERRGGCAPRGVPAPRDRRRKGHLPTTDCSEPRHPQHPRPGDHPQPRHPRRPSTPGPL